MSNISNTNELMEPWGYTVSAVVLCLIGFFGFTFNIVVILLMRRDMQLWNPINIILFNLVCSDFSVSILGNPFAFMSAVCHRWLFGQFLCTLYGFFMALLGINSITTMTVMSFERYYLVKFPFSSNQINNRGAKISVLFIWLYSIAVTSPPLMGWGAYVNEAANISCSVNWETKTNNATSYIVFLFFFGLVLPVIVICFSYINIVLTMRQSSSRLGKKNRSEKKVISMIAAMILAFMIAWTPYAVFALIKQFGDSDSISPAMSVLPSLFAKTSICYNPVIYVGMNSQFRQSFGRFYGNNTATNNTTINTTTINQLSIIGSDTDAQKINSTTKMKSKLQLLNATIEPDDGNKSCTKVDFEMVVIDDGKPILIPKNCYKSDVSLF